MRGEAVELVVMGWVWELCWSGSVVVFVAVAVAAAAD